ncbi:hypothetical protein IKG13_01475 [Candidatus Saccharibacteria bacterium]|nr:hypothetical protein [Candidatus Saccharibacteria bacterium]
MDTGGVENPGAVNSRDDDASATSEQELMDTPIEDNGINFDVVSDSTEATNEEKEYNFSSKDISKREKTDYFVNVAGAEKRAKKAEKDKLKQERRSRKEMLKEASKSKADEAKERNAKEAAKNREAKHIREKYRFEKFRGFVWRYKVIITILAVFATLITLALIFVPKIIDSINQANRENIISVNKSDIMRVFEQVAGKEYSENKELESVVRDISGDVVIDFYEGAGEIRTEDYIERVEFSILSDETENTTLSGFRYVDYSDAIDNGVRYVYRNEDEYLYEYGDKNERYKSAEDAINALIIDKEKESKE